MEISEVRERISTSLANRARRVSLAEKSIEVFLILGGSMAAAGFAFFSDGFSWPLSASQIGGLGGTFSAFLGGVLMVFFRGNDAADLEDARQALSFAYEQVHEAQELYDQLISYEDATEELKALYIAYALARGTIEQALSTGFHDEEKLVQACLSTAARNLKLSLGFQMHHFWTICVYRAEVDEPADEPYLRCIAHDRQISCDLKEARRWPKGVGIGGISFAKNDEVVVPDLLDPAIGTAFRLEKAMMKDEDRTRYRSLFAVPVSVGADPKPWGVVLATSDEENHFGTGYYKGVAPEESVRALAGIVALAVAVCRSNDVESEQ